MALPTDSLTRTRAHESDDALQKAENLMRKVKPNIWESYAFASGLTYGHSRDQGTRASIAPTTTGQRKMRVIGCLLDIPWSTSDANTESLIVTAVQGLIP